MLPQVPRHLENLAKLRDYLIDFRTAILNDSVFDISEFGASPEGSALDNAAAIQDAIDELEANGGGELFIPTGVYAIAPDTIIMPDCDLGITFAPGARFIMAGTGNLFTVPDGLTAKRTYNLRGVHCTGDQSVGQIFLEIADSNSYGYVNITQPKIIDFHQAFYVSAGDLDYTDPVEIHVYDGYIFPVRLVSTNVLISTPNIAGTYAFGCVLYMHNMQCAENNLDWGVWTLDYDGDIISYDLFYIGWGGAVEIDGYQVIGSAFNYARTDAPAPTFAIYGANYWAEHDMENVLFSKINATFSVARLNIRNLFIYNTAQIIIDGAYANINVRDTFIVAATTLALTVNAIYAKVTGIFRDPTTAAISTAASYGTFQGCSFQATSTHATFVETGAADNNKLIGCHGLASGAGVTFIGEDSAIEDETVFEGYMQWSSTTEIKLNRGIGKHICINGEVVGVPSSGMARLTSDNRIDGAGADAGASTAINTLYYVYASNSFATFSPSSIRLSTVAPTAYRGIKHLGTSGNARNWRFVGWVRTISNAGTPNFVDSETQRFVINYYNRRDLYLMACPGYVNDNADTTYTEAVSTTWKEVNGGTGSRISFIANGEDVVEPIAKMYVEPQDLAGDYAQLAIGRENITTVHAQADIPYDGNGANNGSLTAVDAHLPAEGFHEFLLLICVPTATTVVKIYADGSRRGSTIDPKMTYIECKIKG